MKGLEWKITFLGTSAALPNANRGLSGQLLETQGGSILIDCGEGTQLQLFKIGAKVNRIDFILISHLHGDHFYGIPGLLSSFHLLGRVKPLTIIGPEGIKSILDFLIKLSHEKLSYELHVLELKHEDKKVIFSNNELEIESFPLLHSIPTYGYQVKSVKTELNLDKGKIMALNIGIDWYKKLKAGADYVDEHGLIVKNEMLTLPPIQGNSYAYCSDTKYFLKLSDYVKGVSMLYHESTFTDEHEMEAQNRSHSTASQAAKIAHNAKAKQLVLGHFSSRYKDLSVFKTEAQRYFREVILAEDLMEIKFH